MRTFDYSKLASKTWETDILNLVAKIHECKGRQELFVRQKPASIARLVEIASIQSIESSNKIEGIVTDAIRMKLLLAGKTAPQNQNESEILGYRDVLKAIHENYGNIPILPSSILRLHKKLMNKLGGSDRGRFKNVQNFISETRPDGTSVTQFTPVAPHETPAAMKALCAAYKRAIAREEVDALLVIPAFICDFLCIHPFNEGNGKMSRLLMLLLLCQNGYIAGKYASLEKQMEKTKDRYCDALAMSDAGWHKEANDPVPFIRYMLAMILACCEEFEEYIGIMGTDGARNSAYEQVKKYVGKTLGKFTGVDVLLHCPGVGRASALMMLKRLIAEGKVERYGGGRSTYYVKGDPSNSE